MHRAVTPILGAIVVATSIAAGCGLFGGSSSDGPSASDGSTCDPQAAVDEGRRIEVMNAIDARFEELVAADPKTAIPKLVEYAGTFCEVQRVANDGKTILVMRFADGVYYAVSDSTPPDSPDVSASIHAPSPDRSSDPPSFHVESLPASTKYVALRGLNSTWKDPLSTIGAQLVKAGYTEKKLDFTPRALEAPDVLKDVGVLMIDTHGNAVRLTSTDSLYPLYFSFYTSEVAPRDRNAKPPDDYKDDLRAGRITYMSERLDKGKTQFERHYGITSRFVLQYLHPEPGLFVLADACRSLATDEQQMANAFVARDGEQSAAAYLGWSFYVDDTGAEKVVLDVFNYLLGARMGSRPPPVPTRPLDHVVTMEGLTKAGALTVTSTDRSGDSSSATLVYLPRQPTIEVSRLYDPTASIAPGIVRLAADTSSYDRLQIMGDFGFPPAKDDAVNTIDPDAGAADAPDALDAEAGGGVPSAPGVDVSKVIVTIGGASVTILSADYVRDENGGACVTPTSKGRCLGRLVVQLPSDGAGASGDVAVTVRGIKSNTVPYTQWKHVKLHEVQSTASTSCTVTVDWDVGIRADLHPYRASDLTALTVFGQPNGPLLFSADSTLSYSFAGTNTVSGVTYTCSGSGKAKLVLFDAFPTSSPVPVFYVRGWIYSTDQKLPTQPKLHVEGGADGLVATISGSDGTTTTWKTPASMSQQELSLADDGGIQAGSPSTTGAGYTISWPAVSATGAAPTLDTQQ